ncbi:ABC transporter permease [Reichenbachiella carrageenanivorans]|uniref:ABC transporter permease n=1 Tax=Reichenbachiella carrageenanivorans TaxID=2979869 RepID=A0ABY6CWC5_9BACT|nr:FtsX-like permease family protein [Reichenbachiella carrageenanivorans]UXX78217.1 ABC transporter permease [Reichenbachiella carrageenanivorans]
MLIDYIKVTLRSLSKNKLISSINILGLGISLSAFIFITLYIKKELSYDTGHADSERIYRIHEMIKSDNFTENSSSCPPNTGKFLLKDFPDDIEYMVRFFDFQNPIVTIQLENQELYNEKHVYFTDSSVFDMLDFSLIQGNKNTALTAPWTTVVSEGLAKKYWGDENPIGKKITRVGFQNPFEITGVFRQNSVSHIKANMLHSMATTDPFPFLQRNWIWNPAWTYIKLAPNINPEQFEAKLPGFIQKYYDDRTKHQISHQLMPIEDIHLQSHLEFEMAPNSDIKYVYIFASCAVFLLIIAMVNFVNLSTSYSLLRGKEIGVRKVSGATKSQLIIQFLAESIIIAFIAYLIALVLSVISISLLEPTLEIGIFELLNLKMLSIMTGIVFLIGFLSGVYPAFFISSFDPLVVFKGKMISQGSGKILRKVLVIAQFTIAIVLIIFTYVTYHQLALLNNKNYGFDADKIMVLDVSSTRIGQSYDAFRTQLMSSSSIENVTVMSDILAVNNNNHEFNHEGMTAGEWNYYPALVVDEEFVSSMGMKIIAGRDYSVKYAREDSLSMLVNKTMAKTLGYSNPQDAIGQRMVSRGGNEKIVGVVEDFNYKSLHSPIGPFALDVRRNRQNNNGNFFVRHVAIRLNNTDATTMAHLEEVWKAHVNNVPFTYKMLNHELKKLYQAENNMGSILGTFAVLTVIIACLGLFALASFIAQQKMKEIGIRKVLGANFLKLFYVGYKEQFFLIVIAFATAIPLSYYFVEGWLDDFAYRISIGIVPYLVAGLLALVISSLTVLSNFYKVIISNPSEVLRDE